MTSNHSLFSPDKPSSAAQPAAFAWIWFAYLCAFAAAAATLLQSWFFVGDSVLVRALTADVVATLVIFGFSSAFANASFYDAYWSVAPPILAGYYLYAQDAPLDLRAILILALVFAWAIRLTHNWARGWQGLEHEDWRYVDLQESTGKAWWLVNLLGIHLFPTLLVFLGCIALQTSLQSSTQQLGLLDFIASIVGWWALWLEYTADNQLRTFKTNPANAGKVLDTRRVGLVSASNYLGEIGFWVALFIYAWAASGEAAFAPLFGAIWGPVAMLVLFVSISIPMIDKRLAARAGFAEHMQHTFALLPISHLVQRSAGSKPE